jgi:preprotein translocase subunit SecG
MSYFSGCNNLVTMMNFIISTIFIIFTITLQASTAKAENPLQEFSSREELVQWAGYGEEKLSTVLVTGTVLCEACLHGENQLHAWPIPGLSMFLDFLFGLL